MTNTQFAWLAVGVSCVGFVVAYPLTVWAMRQGYGRWVAAALGIASVAFVVVLNRALRGTWSIW